MQRQDAVTTNVNTTNDLYQVLTDLIINPNLVNSEMNTHTSFMKSAAALGYIYFDDGVSKAEPSKFDLYLTLDGVNAATFEVK